MQTAALAVLVWTVLVVGAAMAPWVGQAPSRLAASAVALALLVWWRPSAPDSRRTGLVACGLAMAAGFASYPSWIALTLVAGGLGGFESIDPVPPSVFSLATLPYVAVQLGMAPLFEELLFRERLVSALRASVGALGAVVISSLLFAAAHGEPWRALGALLVGVMLGAVYHRTGSLGWCVAYHLGLNGAAMLCGSPPTRWAMPPGVSLVCGIGLAGLSLWVLSSVAASRLEPRSA